MEDGHAYCTGKPVGVIRSQKQLKNLELVCEWMHKKKGGNSGVFLWASPTSIEDLTAGKGRLPHGIEVQVLDLGYAELYLAGGKNQKADWFTSHGDVFPTGPAKMKPFPPVAPNKKRSFPREPHQRHQPVEPLLHSRDQWRSSFVGQWRRSVRRQ